MRRVIVSDPGDEQPEALFDTATTLGCTHPDCPNKASRCKHDDDIHHGHIEPLARRPRSCLNAWDPRTAAIPF